MIAKIKNALKGAWAILRTAFKGAMMLLMFDDTQMILNWISAGVSAGLWAWGIIALATGGASLLALLGWIFLGGLVASILASIAVRATALVFTMCYVLGYSLYVVISRPKEA